MSYEKLVFAIRGSLYETVIVFALITGLFLALEPVVGRTQASDTFTVTQTVSGVIAFSTNAGDVTMSGTLNGLTGGSAYGTTTVVITTNNASGYNLTMHFSSTTAMIRNAGGQIPEIYNYTYSTATAGYPGGFDTSLAAAQFGFSVNASNTAEVSSVFTGNGTTDCGTGAGTTFVLGNCWRGASSTATSSAPTQLILTSGPTPSSGSTSSVLFRVAIPNGPTPSVPDGTYVATATLTATDN